MTITRSSSRVALAVCSCVFIAGLSTATAEKLALSKIEDERLVRILAMASVKEVDRAKDAGHYLRLYSVYVEGDCVPATHAICAYDYFLAVSTDDSWPTNSVYSLGRLGEVTGVEFISTNQGYRDTIRLGVASYPARALERVPTLANSSFTVDLNLQESVVSIANSF